MIENGGTYPDEKSLYEPVLQAIQSGWATNKGFANYLAVITAAGGRRKTGRWSRPDVTVVARHRYKFVPGRELEVISPSRSSTPHKAWMSLSYTRPSRIAAPPQAPFW